MRRIILNHAYDFLKHIMSFLMHYYRSNDTFKVRLSCCSMQEIKDKRFYVSRLIIAYIEVPLNYFIHFHYGESLFCEGESTY